MTEVRLTLSCMVLRITQAALITAPAGVFLSRLAHEDPAPAFTLTSPALLLVVLAEDAALGVGERCSVTRAMVRRAAAAKGRTGGEEEQKGREEEREAPIQERCAAEIVSVTGEKMPSQTLIQQHLRIGGGGFGAPFTFLLRASSVVTGVLMNGK